MVTCSNTYCILTGNNTSSKYVHLCITRQFTESLLGLSSEYISTNISGKLTLPQQDTQDAALPTPLFWPDFFSFLLLRFVKNLKSRLCYVQYNALKSYSNTFHFPHNQGFSSYASPFSKVVKDSLQQLQVTQPWWWQC